MTPTSEERREVAERLRDNDREHYPECDFFLHAIGMPRFKLGPYNWDKVHERLADLIDTTCQVSSVETYCNELGQLDGWEFHLTCGHSIQRPYYEAPSYCPECGARVAERGEG